jgi:hypothetical protein
MMIKSHGDRVKYSGTKRRTTPEEIGRMIKQNHRDCEARAQERRLSKSKSSKLNRTR